jgi:hypothetical protein
LIDVARAFRIVRLETSQKPCQSKCGFVCLSELEDPEFAGYTDATRGVDFYFW